MVEYLYNLFPNAIDQTSTLECPIHFAISSISYRRDPMTVVEIVQFLLDCDPNQNLKQFQGKSLLHFACGREYNDANIEAGIQMIMIIFDANPEAIYGKGIATNINRYHQQVRAVINSELFYAHEAKNYRQMATPDANGRLPLHIVLVYNVTLGSIKLFVKGNPAALHSADNSGSLPLHIACMYRNSAKVVEYLVELDPSTLDAVNSDGNTALHLACRGAKLDIIELFLEKYGAVSVSTRNKDGKLPIDLLWESNAAEVDRECIEYTESVYRLLRANPEMIMGIDVQMMQSSASASSIFPCQNEKKRKLDD